MRQLRWARRVLLPPVILLASAYLCYLDIVWRDWYWLVLWALLGLTAADRIIKNTRGVGEGRPAEPPGTIEGRPAEPGGAGEDPR